MKLKGILSSILLTVLSLTGCGSGGFTIYIKHCDNPLHGDEDHFIDIGYDQDVTCEDFYNLVIFSDPDSGEENNKLTTTLLIYTSAGCDECDKAHTEIGNYAYRNKVDMYCYDVAQLDAAKEEDGEVDKEEINKIRDDYNYLYRAVAWLYDGPYSSDPVIEEWPSDSDDSSVLHFSNPNVIVFDNNTGATAVLPVGDTAYIDYFDKHFVFIDGDDESDNPLVSEDTNGSN